ncbi:MAG: terpene cyclase/mutase family protein [Planctomycetes bacterium]|nr:terpene cyclase/mutase family protein [Planctomycetota bacterium]
MCDKNYDLIGYVKNGMAPDEKSAIKSHLDSCAECREELRSIKTLFAAFKEMTEIEPSSNFEYRVMQEIEKIPAPGNIGLYGIPDFVSQKIQTAVARVKYTFRHSSPWALSAAFHVVLFAVLGLLFIKPTQTQIEKDYTIRFIPDNRQTERELIPVDPNTMVFKPNDYRFPRFERDDIPASDIPLPALENPEFVQDINPVQPLETLPDSVWDLRHLPQMVRIDSVKNKNFTDHLVNNRTGVKRKELISQYGGDSSTERAVAQGLDWLKKTQELNGSWDPEKHDGLKDYQVGLTGLSLLTFITDGNSSLKGTHQKTVQAGIKYLLSQQQENGLFGPSALNGKTINYMYNHGIATMAVLEDYCQTRDKTEEKAVTKAVGFIVSAQNTQGGWGYQSANGVNDTSITVWQIFALKLAQTLDIGNTSSALKRASQWLASVTNEDGYVGYRKTNNYPNGPYALTAAGMFSQLFIGWDKNDDLIEKQSKILATQLPKMHPVTQAIDNDYYYWYFGTLAMCKKGGKEWQNWNKHLKETLVKAQETNNTAGAGSWAPEDRWSAYGGRLYTTAMAILTLQTYYRYSNI